LVDESKGIPSFVIKLAIYGSILFFLALACLRFYASFLEQKVAVISHEIEQTSLQEVSLSQQLSALKSPNRIHTYCRDTLNMQRSANVVVLEIKRNE